MCGTAVRRGRLFCSCASFFLGGLGVICGAVDLPGMGRGCGSGEDVVVVVVVADGILPSRDLSRFAGILRQVEGHTQVARRAMR